jgi:hypothetical protein
MFLVEKQVLTILTFEKYGTSASAKFAPKEIGGNFEIHPDSVGEIPVNPSTRTLTENLIGAKHVQRASRHLSL